MKKNRILSLALATIMSLSSIIITGNVNATNIKDINLIQSNTMSYQADGCIFELHQNSLELTSYRGTATSITIPSKVNGYTVSAIGPKSFASSNIISVRVPASVTSIKENAFRNCKNLKNIILEEGITEIQGAVFENCSSLKSICIPASVTIFANNALTGSGVEYVSIADGATSVFNGECVNKMKLLRIPNSVTNNLTYSFFANLYSKVNTTENSDNSGFYVKCNCLGEDKKITKVYEATKYYGIKMLTTDGSSFADMNNDGVTSISDATILQRLLCEDNLTIKQLAYGDANNDAIINVSDLTEIQRYLSNAKK